MRKIHSIIATIVIFFILLNNSFADFLPPNPNNPGGPEQYLVDPGANENFLQDRWGCNLEEIKASNPKNVAWAVTKSGKFYLIAGAVITQPRVAWQRQQRASATADSLFWVETDNGVEKIGPDTLVHIFPAKKSWLQNPIKGFMANSNCTAVVLQIRGLKCQLSAGTGTGEDISATLWLNDLTLDAYGIISLQPHLSGGWTEKTIVNFDRINFLIPGQDKTPSDGLLRNAQHFWAPGISLNYQSKWFQWLLLSDLCRYTKSETSGNKSTSWFSHQEFHWRINLGQRFALGGKTNVKSADVISGTAAIYWHSGQHEIVAGTTAELGGESKALFGYSYGTNLFNFLNN